MSVTAVSSSYPVTIASAAAPSPLSASAAAATYFRGQRSLSQRTTGGSVTAYALPFTLVAMPLGHAPATMEAGCRNLHAAPAATMASFVDCPFPTDLAPPVLSRLSAAGAPPPAHSAMLSQSLPQTPAASPLNMVTGELELHPETYKRDKKKLPNKARQQQGRFRTAPVTLDEIREVDEAPTNASDKETPTTGGSAAESTRSTPERDTAEDAPPITIRRYSFDLPSAKRQMAMKRDRKNSWPSRRSCESLHKLSIDLPTIEEDLASSPAAVALSPPHRQVKSFDLDLD